MIDLTKVEKAAQRLGYEAGRKHDEVHGSSYRLSVKTTAELLAQELGIYQEAHAPFVAAYRKGCRQVRKERKR